MKRKSSRRDCPDGIFLFLLIRLDEIFLFLFTPFKSKNCYVMFVVETFSLRRNYKTFLVHQVFLINM